MIKVDRPKIILINLLIIAVGIILIFAGYSWASGLAAILFEAVGTGLIATGGVNLLDRLFTEAPKTTGVSLVSMMRMMMDPKIHDRKIQAVKIDALGVSVTNCLEEIVNDHKQQAIKNILNKPKTRVRIMFVHPESRFLHQRSGEDEFHNLSELVDCQKKSIEFCVQIYTNLKKRYDNEKRIEPNFEPQGTLVIKLIEACPYVTMERYDDDLYWGIYTSDSPGKKAPVFLTTESENPALMRKFKNHFEYLLLRGYENVTKAPNDMSEMESEEYNVLVRVGQKGPWLNEKLVRRLICDDARVNLLLA